MYSMNPVTFRLTDADIAILDEAEAVYGLATRTEALRYLLRAWDGSSAVLAKMRKKKTTKKRTKRKARK